MPKKFAASGLAKWAQELFAIARPIHLQNPPPYEKLVGDWLVLSRAVSPYNTALCMRYSPAEKVHRVPANAGPTMSERA